LVIAVLPVVAPTGGRQRRRASSMPSLRLRCQAHAQWL